MAERRTTVIIVCECGVEFAPGYGVENDTLCQWCDPAMCRCGHTAGNHANGDNGPWGCGLCFECEMFVDAPEPDRTPNQPLQPSGEE